MLIYNLKGIIFHVPFTYRKLNRKVFECLGVFNDPVPCPVTWQTDGVRVVTPQRALPTTFLGQKLNVIKQQSVAK